MNKKLHIAAVAAAVAVFTAPAYAVTATVSGQVNRALMHADDGTNSELLNVDNDNSSTRFRFTGSEDIGGGVKAGLVWEVEYQSQASDSVSPAPGLNSATSSPTFGERKMEVYLAGSFGQVTLGQGDGAMNGGVEVDLSGTSVISYAGTADVGRAIAFVGGGGRTIGNTISQQDFESRYDRVRYDSPALGPVTISISHGKKGDANTNEFGLRFNSDLAGGKIAGAVGKSTRDVGGATGDDEITGGSVSFKAGNGMNATLAFSKRENDAGLDSKFSYLKLGYDMGAHQVSVDFGKGEDQFANGDEAKHIGVQYVYNASKAVDLFAGYKTVSLDATGVNVDDIKIFMAGMNVKF